MKPTKTYSKVFAIDIDGCIMPPNRSEVDLSKLQKLKDYCHFVRNNPEYPQILIYTGRSQGYVEFLSQVLGFTDCPYELPFVIENGTALYFPQTKKTMNILSAEKQEVVETARQLLHSSFKGNAFEPKENIITINPKNDETVEELKEKIILILDEQSLLCKLTITNSASSVDILPKGIDKLFGLHYVVSSYLSVDTKIIAIGDSETDLIVLENCDTAYVPSNASNVVKNIISRKYGKASILSYSHINAVLNVICIHTGISSLNP